jgi:hypothetical protein
MDVNCTAEIRTENDLLRSDEVFQWLTKVPAGAAISAILFDYGNHPDVRLVGLRAEWSEGR